MEKKRIKVLFGVNDFLVGGMQRHLTELLPRLDAERFELILVTLFSFPDNHTLYNLLPPNLEVRRLEFSDFFDVSSWFKLVGVLKEEKPDIVVSSLFFSNTVFRLLQPFFGYATIPREHNTYTWKRWWHRMIDRCLASRSYRILAVSKTVATFTAKQEGIPAEKFVVLHNGVDIEGFQKAGAATDRESVRGDLGLKPNNEVFLNVARLMPQKNQCLLIEGFAKYYEDHTEARLFIVGDGPLREELETFAKACGVGDVVSFFGLQHDVTPFYVASDVFVLTSDIEGFAIVGIEAMALGLPVISTRTAGPDEYIEEGKNGFFIPASTPDAVAASLEKWRGADRASLQQEAQRTAINYDIRAVAAAYTALLEDCYHQAHTSMTLLKRVKSSLRPLWQSGLGQRLHILFFTLFERLSGYALEKRRFKKFVGYPLNLRNPQSLNEKIVWKKIYDRNPLLPVTADKYRVREYVNKVCTQEGLEDILIPLLAVADRPEELPFDTLPDEYIIKTNHDSGGYIMVREGEPLDRTAAVKRLRDLLATPYGIFKHEWAYQKVPRKVIIEKLLRGDDGDLAQDFKLHIFHGTCHFIHTTPKVDGKRSGVRSLFTPDWKLLPVGWKHDPGPDMERPSRLTDMIRIAESLAKPFDYVRVDLYETGEKIYFGEMTHYHGSGMERFRPEDFDFTAGKWWQAKRNYWRP